MSVSIDTANIAAHNGSNLTSWSFSVTVASGDNLLLLFAGNQNTTQEYLSAAPTFNSAPMTLLPGSQVNTGGSNSSLEVYYLINPQVGTFTLAGTYGSGPNAGVALVAVPCIGVNTSTPFYTAATAFSNANNNPAVTATGAGAPDLYIGGNWNKDTAQSTAGSNQTNIYASATINTAFTAYIDTIPGVDAGAFSWTGTGTGQSIWDAVAVGLVGGAVAVSYNLDQIDYY